MNIITADDFVEACKQPVAIGTLISMLAMVPFHIIGMYALFIKIDKMFNPHRLLADQRQKIRGNRVTQKK